MCRIYDELKEIDEMMDYCSNFDEWDVISNIADEICLKISECNIRCGNEGCRGLQRQGIDALFG